ncbi:TPA: transcription-repair coupling factor, partial [Candidatus Sumerlaeota bacterium]|nr:transcription-repair coupling factor [Candidatus Sumerlaeota bacterium]
GVQSYETIKPDLEAYLTLFSARQKQDYSIHLVCDNDGQALRMEELLRSRDLNCRVILSEIKKDQVKKSNAITANEFSPRDLLQGYQDIVICTGPMQTGFIFPDARLLMVTDREMFGRYKRRHVERRKYKGRAIAAVTDIQRGDYVVHIDHGVGRYIGIREQNIDGRLTELIELEYSDGNKLLVPVENVGHVQKYSSTEGAAPALDNLGGTQWKKRRKKSQEKVEQMAKELLEIYAKREAAVGEAFSPDNTWQVEFEDSFLYQETPDQLRAIEEIKADMCSNKPMDRLLCGDVGFGKTEVAMRAVFKCVMEKRQAAVLVPTTILAQQHFHTFRERFADYPVRVGVLSRFCTDAEQRETIRALKKGEVDVVIGTHRLLSTDVEYLDLGLLVVDEEHRFGVAQKEKIKRLRASIDILTLSATPIPRTLHFALGGLRDMSVINTPPRDRLPVRTRVIHFTPNDIQEAITREINRGGQIYFVHNRVETIARVATQIKSVVPKARICIAHGQMHERELEKVMVDFIDRKFDILVATTIIENGLDIPNVNTIIINRADAFGLAQLYQLRGRVGRDVKRAYAYLVVPDGRPVTDTALRRLRAIEEFTELGMGFQIALRDMEIRGVGNLLGSEQHGAIDTVGFEMYCQMLEEAVQLMRGGGQVTDETVEIQWKISALLPSEYVPVESQRLNFYKRCAAVRTGKELEDMRAELRDRYGELPQATLNLLSISLMRILARRAEVSKVSATGKGFTITPSGDLFDFLRRALELREKSKKIKAISAGADGSIVFEIEAWNAEKGIEFAMKILKILGNEPNR